MMGEIREAAAGFSDQRRPGVIYGPEHGGWCGVYLPFPAQQVIGDEQLRAGRVIGNPDRAALEVLAAFVAAMRPNEFDLSGMEIEVLEICKAALATLNPRKVIV